MQRKASKKIIHKQRSPLESSIWTPQCKPANKKIHFSVLCRHWVTSRRLTMSDEQLQQRVSDSQRYDYYLDRATTYADSSICRFEIANAIVDRERERERERERDRQTDRQTGKKLTARQRGREEYTDKHTHTHTHTYIYIYKRSERINRICLYIIYLYEHICLFVLFFWVLSL